MGNDEPWYFDAGAICKSVAQKAILAGQEGLTDDLDVSSGFCARIGEAAVEMKQAVVGLMRTEGVSGEGSIG